MKKILTILGTISLTATSSASVVSYAPKLKNDNLLGFKSGVSKNSCSLNGEHLSTCSAKDVSKFTNNRTTYNSVGTTYIDEWVVNAHYDMWKNRGNGLYTYANIYKLLEGTIPGFKNETNSLMKQTITKTFMSQTLEYANKEISGIYIEVQINVFGNYVENIKFGIFDSWKRFPTDSIESTINGPWGETIYWNGNVNDTGRRSSVGIPKYQRYENDINKLKRDFPFFALPDATARYKSGMGDEMLIQWGNDIFSSTAIQNSPTFFKHEEFNVGGWNMIRLKIDYKISYTTDMIQLAVDYDILAVMPKNTRYGVEIKYGDYFIMFDNKGLNEINNNYDDLIKEVNSRQLPPAGGSKAISTANFNTGAHNPYIGIKFNHAMMHMIASSLCAVNLSIRDMFDNVFTMLFSQYIGASESERHLILDLAVGNIQSNYPGSGVQGFIDDYISRPELSGSNFGVYITSRRFETGNLYLIDPWNSL
ncbi:hypothetical protein CXP39_02000 [Mesoplasma syrphidae]|uniref:DUF31 domain-containing protein n=1 Tax=Mesoplasma syrphidae TaxID=225999 RepID=A0A2K9CD27_9MOLU|nr:lipoprotein [Mesoplasma syrphidae]AUF83564.1 hypothetical protein CXP39_02000 [Mesoplasma syrphidae]